MTQNEKDLLIKDLCYRLPYGAKAYVKNWSKLDIKYYEGVYTITSVHPSLNTILLSTDRYSVEVILGHTDYVIKPYLFPLSSMTEEQWKEITDIQIKESLKSIDSNNDYMSNPLFSIGDLKTLDWCYANHIDYRGLIPMGLAIDATGKNIY